MCDDWDVTTTYDLQDAISEGFLIEIFKEEWGTLSNHKPIVATASVFEDVPKWALKRLWEYFASRREAQLEIHKRPMSVAFHITRPILVIENSEAITFMYVEEY